jgi:hypothetical protein
MVELPAKVMLSGTFRAQSGFPFSRITTKAVDFDGDGNNSPVDYNIAINNGSFSVSGRNRFTAPAFVNTDMRISKVFALGERVKIQPMFEMFNLFNRANPAAVQGQVGLPIPFGKATQVLPGREGQIGLRIEF